MINVGSNTNNPFIPIFSSNNFTVPISLKEMPVKLLINSFIISLLLNILKSNLSLPIDAAYTNFFTLDQYLQISERLYHNNFSLD